MVKKIEKNYKTNENGVKYKQECEETAGDKDRDTDLMDAILKDKLEYAYKSQRLEKQLLKEKSVSLRRRDLRGKEISQTHHVSTKSHINMKSKRRFQFENDVNDITFHEDTKLLDNNVKVSNHSGDEFYKSRVNDLVKNKPGVKEESGRRNKTLPSKKIREDSSEKKCKTNTYDTNVLIEPPEDAREKE